jgi:hypothetical protein
VKIGILTFHDADNHGAVLQAYALKETLKKIEDDTEIINYKQKHIINHYKIIKIDTQNINLLIKSIIKTVVHLYSKSIKRIKFNSFRSKYMSISKEIFYKASEIKGKDAYVVGSDQVWNSQLTHNDEAYFLKFCNKYDKKISYAASIGKDIIDNNEKQDLEKKICNFDYISVREDSAVKIISGLTDKKVYHVLDPTLLADKAIWEKLIQNDNKKYNNKYLLIYTMEDNEELLRIADLVSKRLNLKVLYISDSLKKNRYDFKIIRKVGPIQFISLFKNASFIITNSFHGTAFSIIFNKDFLTVPHKTLGTRMISLLNTLKLNHRLLNSCEELKEDYVFNINYEIPNEILKHEKEKSFAFLKRAIEG